MTTTMLLGLFALPLFCALTYAVLAGGRALSVWLHAKGQNSIIAREAAILDDLAMAVVSDIEANEKAVLATHTGELTVEDGKKLKELAMTRFKAVLAARGMETFQAMLGAVANNPEQLATVLSGKVEQAVARVSAGVVASAIPSPR